LSKAHDPSEVLVSHRNARTTFHARLLIVQRYQAGWAKAHIAVAMGISRKCVRTWMSRFEAEGEVGLADRSSRPHTMPTRIARDLEKQILAWRRRYRCSAEEISAKLDVAVRTVSRVLRRHGVPYLRDLDPMTGVVIPVLKIHRCALRTAAARGTGPHGRQETRTHSRWRRLACKWPQRR
jgi:transposase